jgi:hypothetical protein
MLLAGSVFPPWYTRAISCPVCVCDRHDVPSYGFAVTTVPVVGGEHSAQSVPGSTPGDVAVGQFCFGVTPPKMIPVTTGCTYTGIAFDTVPCAVAVTYAR